MPVKQILVVTCSDHWQQCKFLLDSIDYYLTGYTVVVVDNSSVVKNLSYQMTNNFVQTLSWSDLIPRRIIDTSQGDIFDRGWVSQQLIKLAAHKIFQGDYVCLDTSNVILQSFETTEWPRDMQATVPTDRHMFYEFYLAAVKLLELTSPPVIQPQTPYIFNSSQVADMLNLWPDWDSFESWFTIFSRPSEFWLYDLWLQTQGIANHTVSSHYIQEPILCFYHADGWQNVVSRPGLNFYTVANIKRVLWEDPEFAKLIAKKGLKFLNTGS